MSRPKAITPTVTNDTGPIGGAIKKHPAFGMLRFSRVSGDPGKLFGSELSSHMGSIRMELTSSDERRSLSTTYYHGSNKPLCEVEMSAAQFAELITSLNMGSGVPVTIRYVADTEGARPYIEDTETLHQQIKTEIKAKTERISTTARDLQGQLSKMLAESKLPKAKQAELNALAARIVMDIDQNLPYTLDQYQEAAEQVGAKAKAELDAYATNLIHQLGTKALKSINEGAGHKAIEA